MLLVPVCIVLSHFLPLQPHTSMRTDRYIMLCLCVCVRVGSRLRIHRRPASQPATSPCPRPFPNLSAPSPSSFLPPWKQQLCSTTTPSSPAAKQPGAFFFFSSLPRRPRTEPRGAAMVQRGLSLSLRRAQGWYCSCQTSVCLKLVSAGSGQPA